MIFFADDESMEVMDVLETSQGGPSQGGPSQAEAPGGVESPPPEPSSSRSDPPRPMRSYDEPEIDFVEKFRNAEKLPKIELVKDTTFTPKLWYLYKLLDRDKQGPPLLKRSIRVNLRFKALKYRELRDEVGKELRREEVKVKKQVNRILYLSQGDPGELKKAFKSDGKSKTLRGGDRLSIFNQFSERLIELRKDVMAYKTVEDKAITMLNSGMDSDFTPGENGIDADIEERLEKLRRELEQLTCFNNQPRILEVVAEIVLSFLKNPYFIQDRFMNFLLAGAAGTGKTSIVKRISRVFVAAGMFVYDEVIEGDRSSFVAGYLGQTAERTTSFCKSGLDKGVIFVDEAYSLTTWNDGTLDSYSQEAVNALVDFMTKFKGLYCFMVAGYEKEMRRYFIPSNPGLERRFPFTFLLEEYDEKQMVYIFKYHIMDLMGWKTTGCGEAAVAPVNQLFNWGAWFFLEYFIMYALKGTTKQSTRQIKDPLVNKSFTEEIFEPAAPSCIYDLVKNYAGSMTNLAEETVTFFSSRIPENFIQQSEGMSDLQSVQESIAKVETDANKEVMQEIIKNRLINTSMGDAPNNLREFELFVDSVESSMAIKKERSIQRNKQLREKGEDADADARKYARSYTTTMDPVNPSPCDRVDNQCEGKYNTTEKLEIIEDENEDDLSVATGSGGSGSAASSRQSTKSIAPSRDQKNYIKDAGDEYDSVIKMIRRQKFDEHSREKIEEKYVQAIHEFYGQDERFWPTAENDDLEREFLNIFTVMYNLNDHEANVPKSGVDGFNPGTPKMKDRKLPNNLSPAAVFASDYKNNGKFETNTYTFPLEGRHLEVVVQISYKFTKKLTRSKQFQQDDANDEPEFGKKSGFAQEGTYTGVFVKTQDMTDAPIDDQGAVSLAFPSQSVTVDREPGTIAADNGQLYYANYAKHVNLLAINFISAVNELRNFLHFEMKVNRRSEYLPDYKYPGPRLPTRDEPLEDQGVDDESEDESEAEGGEAEQGEAAMDAETESPVEKPSTRSGSKADPKAGGSKADPKAGSKSGPKPAIAKTRNKR